jgi:hypothetical protein
MSEFGIAAHEALSLAAIDMPLRLAAAAAGVRLVRARFESAACLVLLNCCSINTQFVGGNSVWSK